MINIVNKLIFKEYLTKQLLNVIMMALGYALAVNPYVNRTNPGFIPGLAWFLSGIFKSIGK